MGSPHLGKKANAITSSERLNPDPYNQDPTGAT